MIKTLTVKKKIFKKMCICGPCVFSQAGWALTGLSSLCTSGMGWSVKLNTHQQQPNGLSV